MQKCDARRPCTTCILDESTSQCVYDMKDSHPADVRSSHDTGDRLVPRQNLGGAAQSATQRASKDDQVPRSPGLALIHGNLFGQRISTSLDPSIPVVSSPPLLTIPPEPWIPLSFLGEERFQVQYSETDPTDMDMKLCVPDYGSLVPNSSSDLSRLWALRRLLKLGIHLPREKLESFVRGDLSGLVVSRGLVLWAHAIGMLFSPDVGDTPSMVRFYTRRSQLVWECLAETLKGKDYRAIVRALMVATSGCILLRMTQMGVLYVQKSCDAIKMGNLRFVPTHGRPPEFSEDLHEALANLSQTIYWANYLFLMRDGPEPRATLDLEKEFRQELPVGGATSIVLRIELIQ